MKFVFRVFIFIFIFVLNMLYAQECKKQISFIYVNGVLNFEKNFDDSLDAIKENVIAKHSSSFPNGYTMYADIVRNKSQLLLDFVEAAYSVIRLQTQDDDQREKIRLKDFATSLFRETVNKITLSVVSPMVLKTSNTYDDFIVSLISSGWVRTIIDTSNITYNVSVDKLVQKVLEEMSNGYIVIVISHSQGNLVANDAYHSLVSKTGKGFDVMRYANYQVASPASKVDSPWYRYYTLENDWVIKGVDLLPGISTLESNGRFVENRWRARELIVEGGGKDDFMLHNFVHVYLNDYEKLRVVRGKTSKTSLSHVVDDLAFLSKRLVEKHECIDPLFKNQEWSKNLAAEPICDEKAKCKFTLGYNINPDEIDSIVWTSKSGRMYTTQSVSITYPYSTSGEHIVTNPISVKIKSKIGMEYNYTVPKAVINIPVPPVLCVDTPCVVISECTGLLCDFRTNFGYAESEPLLDQVSSAYWQIEGEDSIDILNVMSVESYNLMGKIVEKNPQDMPISSVVQLVLKLKSGEVINLPVQEPFNSDATAFRNISIYMNPCDTYFEPESCFSPVYETDLPAFSSNLFFDVFVGRSPRCSLDGLEFIDIPVNQNICNQFSGEEFISCKSCLESTSRFEARLNKLAESSFSLSMYDIFRHPFNNLWSELVDQPEIKFEVVKWDEHYILRYKYSQSMTYRRSLDLLADDKIISWKPGFYDNLVCTSYTKACLELESEEELLPFTMNLNVEPCLTYPYGMYSSYYYYCILRPDLRYQYIDYVTNEDGTVSEVEKVISACEAHASE